MRRSGAAQRRSAAMRRACGDEHAQRHVGVGQQELHVTGVEPVQQRGERVGLHGGEREEVRGLWGGGGGGKNR